MYILNFKRKHSVSLMKAKNGYHRKRLCMEFGRKHCVSLIPDFSNVYHGWISERNTVYHGCNPKNNFMTLYQTII